MSPPLFLSNETQKGPFEIDVRLLFFDWPAEGGKCRGGGGRMVGTKCVPTYGGVAGIGGGTSGSLLGPTAAAGWAAVPNSNNQLTWWHWIQASGNKMSGGGGGGAGGETDDDQNCGGDDDDD